MDSYYISRMNDLQTMTPGKKSGIIAILGFLSALGPFTIDMYLPGFASIARDLDTTVSSIGYSLTSYFIGISVGQLFYGPLTDRFGRKGPLLIGLAIYVAASIAIVFTQSLGWLVSVRFLMAIGGCAGIVAGRAVVRDLFPVKEIAQIFSTFILIIALSPMLAPTIGGFLSEGPGWRSIFWSLAGFGTIMFLVVFFLLPESKKADPGVSLRPGRILKAYWEVAREKRFLIFAATTGMSFSALFAYVSSAPALLMDGFGLSQSQFGWAFAINASGLIIGSQVNRLLLRKFSPRIISLSAAAWQVALGAAFAAYVLLGTPTLVPSTVFLFAYLFGSGMINPNATTLTLEPFGRNAGTASALLGAVQMAFGATASGLMSAIAGGMPTLALVAVVTAAVSLVLLLGERRMPAEPTVQAN